MNTKAKARALAAAHGKTILLVDDEPAVREMVGRVLAQEGYRVLTAANGAEAVAMAAADSVDAALLDLNLPGQSGWDTFERLTTTDPFLAVVIITARPNQLLTAINAGVSALLEKPLDFETLLKTVRQVLTESDRRRLERMTGQREDIYYQPVTHPA